MSWDSSIMNLPPGATSLDEIPNDFAPTPLGSRQDVIAKIQSAVPMSDFSDPSWGVVQTPDYVVEFNMGSRDVVDSIMLHVRGGDSVVGMVAEVIHALGVSAIDLQSGDLFDLDSAASSLEAWREYRDGVLGSGS